MSQHLKESMVLCPHCWNRFYPDEAWYISRHPQLYGDDVLGDSENQRFAPHQITRAATGRALDPQGWEMTERACPRCHLQIPADLLERRPLIISVAGSPGSAKTYFITSMIHSLRIELAHSFGMSLHDSDSHEVRAFHEYEQTLFYPANPTGMVHLPKTFETGAHYNKVKLNRVDVQLPKPFIFSLHTTAAHPSFAKGGVLRNNFVLYDNAGESFDPLYDRKTHVQVTQHLGECSAVLFTFDPLQIAGTRKRLAAETKDPQIDKKIRDSRQESVLNEVINRARRYRNLNSRHQIPVPLLVCVQKYDVWKSLIPFSNGSVSTHIDHSSVEYIKSHGTSALDVEEINRISLLVRALIQDICPQFVTLAEANFGVVRYFPVSALGASPEIDGVGELQIRANEIHPFRVAHPLLWLLRRWSLIYRTRRTKDRSVDPVPHAIVERLSDGRLRVKSPYDGKIHLLDDEYEESFVIDSGCGKKMWIPKADLATPPAAPQSPPPPAPQSESLQLKLDPPPPPPSPPKRGWFRK